MQYPVTLIFSIPYFLTSQEKLLPKYADQGLNHILTPMMLMMEKIYSYPGTLESVNNDVLKLRLIYTKRFYGEKFIYIKIRL